MDTRQRLGRRAGALVVRIPQLRSAPGEQEMIPMPRRPVVPHGSSPSEEEVYLEHRSALEATLFRCETPTVTFRLEAGALDLVGPTPMPEGEEPR